jgi:hypothetical protein
LLYNGNNNYNLLYNKFNCRFFVSQAVAVVTQLDDKAFSKQKLFRRALQFWTSYLFKHFGCERERKNASSSSISPIDKRFEIQIKLPKLIWKKWNHLENFFATWKNTLLFRPRNSWKSCVILLLLIFNIMLEKIIYLSSMQHCDKG